MSHPPASGPGRCPGGGEVFGTSPVGPLDGSRAGMSLVPWDILGARNMRMCGQKRESGDVVSEVRAGQARVGFTMIPSNAPRESPLFARPAAARSIACAPPIVEHVPVVRAGSGARPASPGQQLGSKGTRRSARREKIVARGVLDRAREFFAVVGGARPGRVDQSVIEVGSGLHAEVRIIVVGVLSIRPIATGACVPCRRLLSRGRCRREPLMPRAIACRRAAPLRASRRRRRWRAATSALRRNAP